MIKLDEKRNLGRLAAVTTLKYAIAAVVTAFVIPEILYNATRIGLLASVIQLLVFPLVIAYAGRMVELLGHPGSGSFVKIILAPTFYALFVLNAVFGDAAAYYHNPTINNFVIPTVVLILSAQSLYFGIKLIDLHIGTKLGLVGVYATKSSKFVLTLSVGLYLYSLLYLNVLYPALLAVAVSGIFLSTWVLTTNSTSKTGKNFTAYFKNSAGKWIALMGVIGFFYGLVQIPKPSLYNEILFVLFTIMAGLAILYLVLKVYVVTSRYVERIAAATYKKYEYSSDLITNKEIDYISQSTRLFIAEGMKDSVIIAFSSLLSRRELPLTEIDALLRPLKNYHILNADLLAKFNIRRALENEMKDRYDIVKLVMNRIAKLEETETWKQATKAV